MLDLRRLLEVVRFANILTANLLIATMSAQTSINLASDASAAGGYATTILPAELRLEIFELAVASPVGISLQVVGNYGGPAGAATTIRFRPLGVTQGDGHPEVKHDGDDDGQTTALRTWINIQCCSSETKKQAFPTLFKTNNFRIIAKDFTGRLFAHNTLRDFPAEYAPLLQSLVIIAPQWINLWGDTDSNDRWSIPQHSRQKMELSITTTSPAIVPLVRAASSASTTDGTEVLAANLTASTNTTEWNYCYMMEQVIAMRHLGNSRDA